MDVGKETAHDRMVRAEHRDPSGEKYEPGNHRQQTANRAQDQQANPDNGADNVPQVSW